MDTLRVSRFVSFYSRELVEVHVIQIAHWPPSWGFTSGSAVGSRVARCGGWEGGDGGTRVIGTCTPAARSLPDERGAEAFSGVTTLNDCRRPPGMLIWDY